MSLVVILFRSLSINLSNQEGGKECCKILGCLSQEKQAYCLAPWEREVLLLYHTFGILGGYLAPIDQDSSHYTTGSPQNLNINKNVWLCVL